MSYRIPNIIYITPSSGQVSSGQVSSRPKARVSNDNYYYYQHNGNAYPYSSFAAYNTRNVQGHTSPYE